MLVTILYHVDKFLRYDKDYYRKGQPPLSTNEQKRHKIGITITTSSITLSYQE